MQGISRSLAGIALAATLAAVAVAFAVGGGGGGGPDFGQCMFIYFLMTEVVLVSFIVCLLQCNRDTQCESRCVRFYIYLLILVQLLLILCLFIGQHLWP